MNKVTSKDTMITSLGNDATCETSSMVISPFLNACLTSLAANESSETLIIKVSIKGLDLPLRNSNGVSYDNAWHSPNVNHRISVD